MTSLKTSLRNTGWRRHTPKISWPKSDISPEWLYHSRSRFLKKLMVNVGVSWNRKTNIFFINPQKTKVDQNCNIDLLKTSLLPECRRHYPGSDFEFLQDSVPSHHTKVTQQFLQQNTPDFIAADEWASYSPDLNPLDYCIWDIRQDLVYKGWRLSFASLQDMKETIKNKWKEVTIETVRKLTAQRKKDWMLLESRMQVRFSTFSINRCDWILISCSEKCWNYIYFVLFGHPILCCVFHCRNKSV